VLLPSNHLAPRQRGFFFAISARCGSCAKQGRAATRSYQQLGQVRPLLRDLIHRALPRRLIWPPAQEFRPVAKALPGEMIVSNFDDEPRLERLPLCRAAGRPSARPARRAASESRPRDEPLELDGERLLRERRIEDVDGGLLVLLEAGLSVGRSSATMPTASRRSTSLSCQRSPSRFSIVLSFYATDDGFGCRLV
jgi:hypothetical protein